MEPAANLAFTYFAYYLLSLWGVGAENASVFCFSAGPLLSEGHLVMYVCMVYGWMNTWRAEGTELGARGRERVRAGAEICV